MKNGRHSIKLSEKAERSSRCQGLNLLWSSIPMLFHRLFVKMNWLTSIGTKFQNCIFSFHFKLWRSYGSVLTKGGGEPDAWVSSNVTYNSMRSFGLTPTWWICVPDCATSADR